MEFLYLVSYIFIHIISYSSLLKFLEMIRDEEHWLIGWFVTMLEFSWEYLYWNKSWVS